MPSIKSSIWNYKHISLDDVCFLISTTSTEDELGQPINIETERQIFCSELSITRAEFSTAGQRGYKPQLMVVVDSDEYGDEGFLKFKSKKYSIYKTFMRQDGYTELYCEVKIGD